MSKLSFHISNWLDADTTYDLLDKTRPPVVKVFGDAGLDDMKIREARKRSPHTLWIGRKYFGDQLLEHIDDTYPGDAIGNYDPAEDAQNVFQQMQEIVSKLDGLIDVWEGLNEVPIDTDAPLTERNLQKARAYSAFTVALAKLMHDAGQKFAAYSFSTGNPVHVELWECLTEGLSASDYLALHEYIAPDEQWHEFDTGMCNRYRGIYARVPAEARRPVLITECGDDYIGRQGYHGAISDDLYLSHLKAYDAELMKDPLALGATIFCYGINDKRWKSYDIGGDFSRMLADYIAATPTPTIEPAKPEPAEPGVPEHEEPVHPQEPLEPSAGSEPELEQPIEPAAPAQPKSEQPVEPAPPVEPEPEKPVEPANPAQPQPQPALALNDARWWTEEATRQIEGNRGANARAILIGTVIPWFYASVPAFAEPAAAQAHTRARWFAEEAVRKLEAQDLASARKLLISNVIPWFYWH